MGYVFVEFFSEEALENVMILLKYHPEKVIFLGHKYNMTTRKINSLMNFTRQVSPDTVLQFVEVPRDNLDEILSTLNAIIDENPECIFELTGNGELLFIAFGYISTRRSLKSLRIDPYTCTEYELSDIENGPRIETEPLSLSVANNMILHGGSLTRATGNYSTWRFTQDFLKDIRTIWGIASSFNANWNKYCAIIEDVLKANPEQEYGQFLLPKGRLGDAIEIFRILNKKGMIKEYHEYERRIEFLFKNDMIKKIITKIGNILELHVYEVATRKPTIFTDAIIGAMIDWDGRNANSTENNIYAAGPFCDTLNEIDVILMHNVCPTFISCKSGKAGSAALHELETVTRRFGGKYAKKVLVMANKCDNSANGASYFKKRAKDMHIWVIDNVYKMKDEDLIHKLEKIQNS